MYLAVDVGGTKINISFFRTLELDDLEKEIILETSGKFDEDVHQITETALAYGAKLEAVGISLPGFIVDEKKGVVSAANIPDWEGKDLRAVIEKHLQTGNVFMLHDGKAHAMTEVMFKKTDEDFMFIAWGTGIGATYIRNIDGKVHAQQIEFGYQTIRNEHLSDLVGGNNFEKRFSKNPSKLTADDWDVITTDFAIGLSNVFALNYPPLIIWGGGVAIKNENQVKIIMEKAHERYPFWDQPKYRMASFGDRGGVLGALAEIKYQLSL